MKYIELKPRYKYMLAENFSVLTGVKVAKPAATEYIRLDGNGKLTILANYCWDGASGGMHDDDTNMTPSLIHDAFYQLLRLQLIPYECKVKIDKLFVEMCKARGMNSFRAWYYHRGLQFAAPRNPEKGDQEVVLEAP